MRHDRRVFYQGFNASQTFGQREYLYLLKEGPGGLQATFDKERDDPSKTGHLFLCNSVVGVRFKAWVNRPDNPWMIL